MLSEHQSKTGLRAFVHRSNLSQPLLFSHKHNSSQLLLFSSEKRVSPPSDWSQAAPPTPHSGLQRSLWEDVNSAPSLPQKRVTRDLLDPLSRAWSTRAVREAEVKSHRAGAMHVRKPKREVPEHRRQPLTPG